MKVGILGTGAYGLALSSIMYQNKCEITMWTDFENEKEMLVKDRCNKNKLPDYKIPSDIKITTDIKEVTIPSFPMTYLFSYSLSIYSSSLILLLI